MTRKEFEKVMDQMSEIRGGDKCPKHLIAEYWATAEAMTVEQFTQKLEKQFRFFRLNHPVERFTLFDKIEEFTDEVNKLKYDVSELLRELMSSNAGHTVLEDLADSLDYDLEVNGDEISLIGRPEKKHRVREKCPDTLTSDIMRVLRGEK